MHRADTPPAALTIAATDSGGGAGLAADLRTFAAHGVHGTLAVTAVTAQDTVALKQLFALSAATVAAQIDAVTADIRPLATKTGMLVSNAIAAVVTERARASSLGLLVVDPVLVTSSGRPLFAGNELSSLLAGYRKLISSALVVTPNLPEAALLAGLDESTFTKKAGTPAMEEVAKKLHELGPGLVVVKGGRLPHPNGLGDMATDVAYDGVAVTHIEGPFVVTPNVHGTGCSLSAAITARLALGEDPLAAAVAAKTYVTAALIRSAGWRLGSGHGAIDQLELWRRRQEAEVGFVGSDRQPDDAASQLST